MHKVFEEILESIFTADEAGDVTVSAVRARCPIDVGEDDLGLLHKRGLIVRTGDRLQLTYEGRAQATAVVRRHRLAEVLFATVLDVSPERQHELACEAEHTLLPEVEEGICILLGHPTLAPDGKPIPPGTCCEANRSVVSSVIVALSDLAPGERGRISSIRTDSHDRLHRLTSYGVTTGTVVEVRQQVPAVCIRFGGAEVALDHEVATEIYVARLAG